MTTETIDPAEQLAMFAACVYDPDDLVEARYLKPPGGGKPAPSTFHKAGNLAQGLATFTSRNRIGYGIYLSPNPRIGGNAGIYKDTCTPERRCGKASCCVKHARCLFAEWDSDAGTLELVASKGMPTPTLTLFSGRGMHCYWRLSEPIDVPTWEHFTRGLIDLLGNCDPAVKDPSRVMRAPGFVNTKWSVTAHIVDADPTRVYDLADLADVIPDVTTTTSTATTATIEGMGAPIPGEYGGSNAVYRARKWLEKRDGAIEGQHGSDHTYRTACMLVRDFNLGDDEALLLMEEWNMRCVPPWDQEKLKEFIEHAHAYGKDAYGKKLDAVKSTQQALTTMDAKAAEGVSASDEVLDPAKVKNALQLLNDNDKLHPPIVEGLLREGELMNLISNSKVGKSWLVLNLALSVVSGRPWLGRYPVKQGPVLLIDNELHPATLASRIHKVAQAMDVDLIEFGPSLNIEPLRGRLQDVVSMRKYFDAITPGHYRMVIIDALYRMIPPDTDENSNGDMARVYNFLDRYAQRTRASFTLVHHTSKGLQSDRGVTDVGAGAGAISRATDSHLVLRQHEEDNCVSVDAAVRSWPKIEPFVMRWTFPTWEVDESLDPADLKRPKRNTKPKVETEKPKRPVFTPEAFVDAFVGKIPQKWNVIELDARRQGQLSVREATGLRDKALAAGLMHKHVPKRKSDPVKYATVPPLLYRDEQARE